ncbi:MAG TPA: hypothetical protein VHI93_02380 [Candidatus Thermoplasmatota archaeon]|nr:hypothetical protein [Candidatus Thermoplasmatota archaeon]
MVSLCADGRAAVEGPTDARAGQEFSILAFDLHGNATPFRLLVQDEAGRPVMDTPQDEIEGASPDAPARWFRVPAIPRGTYVLAWKGGEARFDPFGPATSC